MLPVNKRWIVRPPLPLEVEQELVDYHPVLKQLLYNRGFTSRREARLFLEAQPCFDTNPMLIAGIPTAVERLLFAIQKQEPIAIYGDYDVDGVTATALLVQFLENLGAQARGYIPNRFDEGYGLNTDALASLHTEGFNLVITVDCGIRSPLEADYARSLGMELIISDHHHPGKEVPAALAVINPRQSHDTYPEKNLTGVGLAYKIADSLVHCLEEQGDSFPQQNRADAFLDLVALGTIADLAPLTGENRALVRNGLNQIHLSNRQGLVSLIGAAGLTPRNVTASDIGFILAPRLNAAGRLESALDAFRLLVAYDVNETGQLAQKLDNQNRERQKITAEIQQRAEEMIAAVEEQFLLFAVDPNFNPGVVGLAASRLMETYYRPTAVAQYGAEFTRGSCRSIPEFHITAALDECADLLEHYGGHAAAAGFTVRNERLPELVTRLQDIARAKLSGLDLRPVIYADMEILLSDLKPELIEYLKWLEPTGRENHQALFLSRGLRVTRSRTVGRENAHLKLTITDGRITYDAIAFRQGEWQAKMPQFIDILYTFELNEYNGYRTLQLNVRDLRPAI